MVEATEHLAFEKQARPLIFALRPQLFERETLRPRVLALHDVDRAEASAPKQTLYDVLILYQRSGGIRGLDLFHAPPHKLIDDDSCVPIGMRIDPPGIALTQIDAAVAPIEIVGRCSNRVLVRKLRSRPERFSPGSIVDEVAAQVIEHGVVNRRVGEPVGRVSRLAGLKDDRRLALQYRPYARDRWQLLPTRCDGKGAHQLPILIIAHGYGDHRDQ